MACVRARLCEAQKGALDSQPEAIKFTSYLSNVGGSLKVLRLYFKKINNKTSTIRSLLRKKMEIIIEQFRQYSTDEVSRSNFINSVGYKFSARTDL
jgi:hypothetical protein